MNIYEVLFFITLALYILWVLSFVFLEKRKENSLISWLLVFIAFPFFGFLIYLLFGKDMSKKKVFRLYKAEEELMEELKQKSRLRYNEKKEELAETAKESSDIIELTTRMTSSGVYFDNRLEIYTDGFRKFGAFLQDIEEAKEEINIAFFIYERDELGTRVRDALARKAAEGVTVRLLLDDFGSFKVHGGFFKKMKEAGAKVSFSMPISLLNLQINNRNHRKLAIIDRKIAYIGGFNIGDEYLGLNKARGYWRDTHLRLTGSCINDLQVRFLLDWRNAGNEDFQIQADLFREPEVKGDIPIQILSSGPDSKLEEIKLAYLEMINRAREYILLQTPYFVPDEAMFEALRLALIRGVDVRIMIPDKKDHMFVYWATYSFIGDLLPLGLKAYTYERGFLHAKTILVDGEVFSVGSANFDKRSFKLSFECNAFIYSTKIGEEMKRIFMEDMEYCRELTLERYEKRSLAIRIKEPISRIISPIL